MLACKRTEEELKCNRDEGRRGGTEERRQNNDVCSSSCEAVCGKRFCSYTFVQVSGLSN